MQNTTNGWSQQRADCMLALVAIAWGSAYLLMKVGLGGLGIFGLITLRFAIAFPIAALLFHKRLRQVTRRTLGYSAILGLLLLGTLIFVMGGLRITSASSAGFATSTCVVFVPILQTLLTRRLPSRQVVVSTLVTLFGILLLTTQGALSFDAGAALCLGGALLFAVQTLVIDRMTRKEDGLLLGICQLGFTGLFGFVGNLLFEPFILPENAVQWGAVLGLALICSCFGLVMQPVAQQYTTPEHAGVLFSLEPVASALLAFLFLGERLSLQGYLGAALVLAGVLLTSRPPKTPS